MIAAHLEPHPAPLPGEQAILRALKEVGTKTQLLALQKRSQEIYGGKIGFAYVGIVRGEYREEKGLEEDCRTYETQRRRHMLRDDKLEAGTFHELRVYFAKQWDIVPETFNELEEKFSHFHSIDQLRLFLRTMASYDQLVASEDVPLAA